MSLDGGIYGVLARTKNPHILVLQYHVAATRIHYMLQINSLSLSLSHTVSYESQKRSHHKIP